MRRKIFIRNVTAAALLVLPLAASCTRVYDDEGRKLVLAVSDASSASLAGTVETRAALINDLPGTLYWGVTKGAIGSEEVVQAPTAGTPDGEGKIETEVEQNTGSPKTYNCYVTNISGGLSLGTSATLNVSNNSVDVMAGKATTTTASADITLSHVFTALGTLSFTPPSGTTVTSATWSITGHASNPLAGTAGTYDLATGTWTAVTTPMTGMAVTSGSNLLLIPGRYTMTATVQVHFTVSGNNQTIIVTGDLDMPAGRVCNVTGTYAGILMDYDDGWSDDGEQEL